MILQPGYLNSFTFMRAQKARFFCGMRLLFFLILLLSGNQLLAQFPGGGQNLMQRMPGGGMLGGRSMGSSGGPFKDSLLHRTGLEDSATIMFRYLDTARFYFLDSSVSDYTRRWPVPWTSNFMGNHGNAVRSMLFSPNRTAGWDHGMHAYDPYIIQLSDVKFYNTSRPFTQLSYILGSKQEQNIGVFHTQNIRYNWNFSFEYKLLNSPGIFKNQKTNHNSYLFNTWYTSPNRKYSVFFIASSSRTGSTENGGIRDVSFLDSVASFSDRFNIPTNFGGTAFESQSFLSNVINTGNRYTFSNVLFRHSYDFGKKDSVETDSSVVYLFYPRLRLQHTVRYEGYQFQFIDTRIDTASYRRFYGLTGLPSVFEIKDAWNILTNEFAVYQYPDVKNQQQFIKAAAGYQQLRGDFGAQEPSFNNVYVNGEYRNKTRNRKWDMELAGTFFAAGTYIGDYQVQAYLKRLIGKKLGYLSLGFENVNRTPSFIHNDLSNFKRFNIGNTNFNKENTTILSGTYELPQFQFTAGARYYLLSNFTYFKSYTQATQEAALFNLLQVQLQKQFRISKRWNWYTEVWLQQTTGNAPVNVPFLLTRNRLAYEGRFFKNLNLSTGLELRYHTAYKADGFSPLLGQFFLQNQTTIRNRPDITGYAHIRIRSLYLFIRAENLNALSINPSFGFLRNNLVAPQIPLPGLYTRFGIFWGFVN